MTGEEILKQLILNNARIEELVEESKGIFILNLEIEELIQKNKELCEKCPHDDNGVGFCKYCQTKLP